MNLTMEHVLCARLDEATAYHALITGMEHMVLNLASRFWNGRDTEVFDDLKAEGHLAVAESAFLFQQGDRPARFSTVAYQAIHRRMVSYLRHQCNGSVHRTDHGYKQNKKAQQRLTELTEKLGRAPSLQEFADQYGYTLANHLMSITSAPLERDVPTNGGKIPFNDLPEPTRLVVEAISEGASLGEIAVEWDVPRADIYARARSVAELL